MRRTAAYACKQIEQYANGQNTNGLTLFLEPEDYADLLPSSFDVKKHDNLILSSAFRYKALHPVILTDDTNFRNISRSQGIQVKEWKEFVEERGLKSIRSSEQPVIEIVQEKEMPKPSAAPLAGSNASSCKSEENQEKEDYLAQSIDILKLPPFNLSGKNIKTLQSAGFNVLNDILIVTTSTINQNLKSSSARSLAKQVKDKLTAKVSNEF